MVSLYHLIRPNIGYLIHSVPYDRDLRMGENGVADCLSQAFMCPVFQILYGMGLQNDNLAFIWRLSLH